MVIQFHSKTVYICKLKLAKGEKKNELLCSRQESY
mgnify:CR=1 FL=1